MFSGGQRKGALGTNGFKKIKKKNLGQNKNNLINYLNKDYGYSKESTIEAVEQAVTENMVKIVLFSGKNSHRIVDKDDNTVLVPGTVKQTRID